MMTCRVEFICDNDQKLILPFTLNEDNTLEYKILSDPPITDPKLQLGLGGILLEKFMEALQANGTPDNIDSMPENEG